MTLGTDLDAWMKATDDRLTKLEGSARPTIPLTPSELMSALEQAAEALKPFAKLADAWGLAPSQNPALAHGPRLTFQDCIRAKAALDRINDGT